jgi:ribosomal protein L12E/L44/L45/RPP1/RPP2
MLIFRPFPALKALDIDDVVAKTIEALLESAKGAPADAAAADEPPEKEEPEKKK